jgi:hypothetical protein
LFSAKIFTRLATKLSRFSKQNKTALARTRVTFIFSIATPVYGTELYEQAKRGGFLRDCFSDEASAGAEPLIETPELRQMNCLDCARRLIWLISLLLVISL